MPIHFREESTRATQLPWGAGENHHMKTLSPNQVALLKFIRDTHATTRRPVTHGEMVLAHVIPSKFLTTTRVALMDRGLIDVHERGVAAWVPCNE